MGDERRVYTESAMQEMRDSLEASQRRSEAERERGVMDGLKVAALILRDGNSYTMAEGADPLEWMARIIDARAIDGAVSSYLYRLSNALAPSPSDTRGEAEPVSSDAEILSLIARDALSALLGLPEDGKEGT